jgi:hypothetical protein
MTEAEWLAASDPRRMLKATGNWSDRKAGLNAIACCHLLGPTFLGDILPEMLTAEEARLDQPPDALRVYPGEWWSSHIAEQHRQMEHLEQLLPAINSLAQYPPADAARLAVLSPPRRSSAASGSSARGRPRHGGARQGGMPGRTPDALAATPGIIG